MIAVQISAEMRSAASVKAGSIGVRPGSIRSGHGNVYGCLGELIASAVMGGKLDGNSFEFDLTLPSGEKVDVKTKCCTSEPKPEYLCSVAEANHSQRCDHYAFVRVLQDCSRGWFLGSISVPDFYHIAKFWRKGDVDPSSDRGFRFKADCYNVKISDLFSPVPVNETLTKPATNDGPFCF